MAYDEHLVERIRACVADDDRVAERRMFGGVIFTVGGNIAVGASHTGALMVRLAVPDAEELAGPGVEPVVMQGRAMRGWLYVDSAAVEDDDDLADWVARGIQFAGTLPRK
jgi:TfoX/Sxy family transcriptional regulator of competence genes